MNSDYFEFKIDPTQPIHDQIRRVLENRIRFGELKLGEKLPSESELEQIFGVSRTPVRQALSDLERSGLIYRAQGKGSFVKEPKIQFVVRSLTSFRQDLRDAGIKNVETKTLSLRTTFADAETARELRIEMGETIIEIRRLYTVDSLPLVLFNHKLLNIFPLELFKREKDFPSLYEILQGQGIEPTDAHELISACQLESDQAELLKTKVGAAALLIKRTTLTEDERPLEFSTYVIPGDRYEMRIFLRRMI